MSVSEIEEEGYEKESSNEIKCMEIKEDVAEPIENEIGSVEGHQWYSYGYPNDDERYGEHFQPFSVMFFEEEHP